MFTTVSRGALHRRHVRKVERIANHLIRNLWLEVGESVAEFRHRILTSPQFAGSAVAVHQAFEFLAIDGRSIPTGPPQQTEAARIAAAVDENGWSTATDLAIKLLDANRRLDAVRSAVGTGVRDVSHIDWRIVDNALDPNDRTGYVV